MWEQQQQQATNSSSSPSTLRNSNNTTSINIISNTQQTSSKEATATDLLVDNISSSSNIKMDSTCSRKELLQQHHHHHHHQPHHDQAHGYFGEGTTTTTCLIASSPKRSGGGLGGLGRTKSVFSMTSSFVSSTSSLGSAASTGSSQDEKEHHHQHQHHQHHPQHDGDDSEDHFLLNGFAMDVQVYTGLGRPVFDSGLRKVMEPYLRKARCERERARPRRPDNNTSRNNDANSNNSNNNNYLLYHVDASIANSVGVPYTCLRHERPFLFNEHTFPLHTILAQALGVSDLSRLHVEGGGGTSENNNMNNGHHHHDITLHDEVDVLLKPLLDRERRRSFHLAYHNFVTSFCIPLLHSLAISQKLLHAASASCDYVTYRYQSFPRISISQPGSAGSSSHHSAPHCAPHCAMARGHAVGCLFFHVPLTPSLETAALHVESHPGREDWHALEAKSVGLGYLYDGARCLQFETTNTGTSTRVSIEFSVLIYRESTMVPPNSSLQQQQQHQPKEDLCTLDTLEDSFSRAGPGYYEEAVIDLTRRNFYPAGCMDAVHRKNKALVDPDYRVGPPFCTLNTP